MSDFLKKTTSQENSVMYGLQSWTGGNFLASRQRQCDNVIDPQGPKKCEKYLGLGV